MQSCRMTHAISIPMGVPQDARYPTESYWYTYIFFFRRETQQVLGLAGVVTQTTGPPNGGSCNVLACTCQHRAGTLRWGCNQKCWKGLGVLSIFYIGASTTINYNLSNTWVFRFEPVIASQTCSTTRNDRGKNCKC